MNNRIIKESELEEECGVTKISLKRSMYFKQHGWKPFQIQISGKDTADVKVDVFFRDEKNDEDRFFNFTGFSIGYPGTGPKGLEEFFKLFNIELSNFSPLISSIKDGPYCFNKYLEGWKKG